MFSEVLECEHTTFYQQCIFREQIRSHQPDQRTVLFEFWSAVSLEFQKQSAADQLATHIDQLNTTCEYFFPDLKKISDIIANTRKRLCSRRTKRSHQPDIGHQFRSRHLQAPHLLFLPT